VIHQGDDALLVDAVIHLAVGIDKIEVRDGGAASRSTERVYICATGRRVGAIALGEGR
jgi:hypothetical protein